MKICQFNRICVAIAGFHPNQQQNNNSLFSPIQLGYIIIFMGALSSIGIYIYWEADSIGLYMDSFVVLSGAFWIFVAHVSFILNNDKLFDAINGAQKIANNSKFPLNIHKRLHTY